MVASLLSLTISLGLLCLLVISNLKEEAMTPNREKLQSTTATFEVFRKNAQAPVIMGTIEQALESYSEALEKLERAKKELQKTGLVMNREGLTAMNELVG